MPGKRVVQIGSRTLAHDPLRPRSSKQSADRDVICTYTAVAHADARQVHVHVRPFVAETMRDTGEWGADGALESEQWGHAGHQGCGQCWWWERARLGPSDALCSFVLPSPM